MHSLEYVYMQSISVSTCSAAYVMMLSSVAVLCAVDISDISPAVCASCYTADGLLQLCLPCLNEKHGHCAQEFAGDC